MFLFLQSCQDDSNSWNQGDRWFLKNSHRGPPHEVLKSYFTNCENVKGYPSFCNPRQSKNFTYCLPLLFFAQRWEDVPRVDVFMSDTTLWSAQKINDGRKVIHEVHQRRIPSYCQECPRQQQRFFCRKQSPNNGAKRPPLNGKEAGILSKYFLGETSHPFFISSRVSVRNEFREGKKIRARNSPWDCFQIWRGPAWKTLCTSEKCPTIPIADW